MFNLIFSIVLYSIILIYWLCFLGFYEFVFKRKEYKLRRRLYKTAKNNPNQIQMLSKMDFLGSHFACYDFVWENYKITYYYNDRILYMLENGKIIASSFILGMHEKWFVNLPLHKCRSFLFQRQNLLNHC